MLLRKLVKMKRKTKRPSIKTAKAKAWKAFSRYIRLRDSLATTGTLTECVCATCGKRLPTFFVNRQTNYIQAGHAIDGRGKNILFDEEAVYGQCQVCNVVFNGRLPEYTLLMEAKYGKEYWAEKIAFARKPAKMSWRIPALDEIREKYTALTEEIEEQHGTR